MKKIPIRIDAKFMTDKNFDYHALGVISFFGTKDYGKSISLNQKYLYEHKEEVEDISQKKLNSIYRVMKKMSKEYKDIISVSKDIQKKNVYHTSYCDKSGKGYILIEEDALKTLLRGKDTNIIKTYLLLKMICKNNKKIITREYICRNIGLSPNSSNNLSKISKITDFLEKNNLIKKEYIVNQGCTNNIIYSII